MGLASGISSLRFLDYRTLLAVLINIRVSWRGGGGGWPWDLPPSPQNLENFFYNRLNSELGEGKVLSVKQFSKTRRTAKSLPTPPNFSLFHPEMCVPVTLISCRHSLSGCRLGGRGCRPMSTASWTPAATKLPPKWHPMG